MKKLNKTISPLRAGSIIWTVLFLIGMPMIILGASKISSNAYIDTPMMIAGIVFTASGFYGMPIMWITYASKKELRPLAYAVNALSLVSVEKLSLHLGKSEEEVRAKIDVCLNCGYLDGYVREGNGLKRASVTEDTTRQTNTVICPMCLGKIEYKGESVRCPYCGSVYDGETSRTK